MRTLVATDPGNPERPSIEMQRALLASTQEAMSERIRASGLVAVLFDGLEGGVIGNIVKGATFMPSLEHHRYPFKGSSQDSYTFLRLTAANGYSYHARPYAYDEFDDKGDVVHTRIGRVAKNIAIIFPTPAVRPLMKHQFNDPEIDTLWECTLELVAMAYDEQQLPDLAPDLLSIQQPAVE